MDPPSGRKRNRYSSRPKYRYRKHNYTALAGRKLNPELREQGAKTTVDALIKQLGGGVNRERAWGLVEAMGEAQGLMRH